MRLKHLESALSSVQREFPNPNVRACFLVARLGGLQRTPVMIENADLLMSFTHIYI
jgi:hypothetical protein